MIGCHQQIEAKANYAAGQLLFLRERFMDEARSLSPGFDSINKLQSRYQNTITTTPWRYVELNSGTAVAAISAHPHRTRRNFSSRNPLRYFIRSRSFQQQFPGVTEAGIFQGIQKICSDATGGLLGGAR